MSKTFQIHYYQSWRKIISKFRKKKPQQKKKIPCSKSCLTPKPHVFLICIFSFVLPDIHVNAWFILKVRIKREKTYLSSFQEGYHKRTRNPLGGLTNRLPDGWLIYVTLGWQAKHQPGSLPRDTPIFSQGGLWGKREGIWPCALWLSLGTRVSFRNSWTISPRRQSLIVVFLGFRTLLPLTKLSMNKLREPWNLP